MPLAAALHSYYVSVYIGRSSKISSDGVASDGLDQLSGRNPMSLSENNPGADSGADRFPTPASAPTAGAVQTSSSSRTPVSGSVPTSSSSQTPMAGAAPTSSSSQTPDAAASASAADRKKWLRTARATLLQAAIPLVLAWITAMALPFFNYEYYKWAMSVLVCAVCWAAGCMFYAAKMLKLSLKDCQ